MHTHAHKRFMYVYSYIHTCKYKTHGYIHGEFIHTNVRTCIHTYTDMNIKFQKRRSHSYAYTYVHAYMHTYIHRYEQSFRNSEAIGARRHVCMYVYTYVRTYMHTYTDMSKVSEIVKP